MKERLLVGLDIGTSSVRFAAGQITLSQDKRQALTIIGATECPSQGISKGIVTSLEDVVSSISACLEQGERILGMPIYEATVGIGGIMVNCQSAKGVIGVSRTDGEIRPEDVARAIDAAKAFVNPANQEILHVLPRDFSIDGQSGIKDPIGMQGIRLEVDAMIIQGQSNHVHNLTKAVFRTKLDISELIFTPLALVEAVTTSREREVGVCALSIGASTTGVAVYENGELLEAAILPIGADYITNDIARGLRISLDSAERIKRMYGTAVAEAISKRGQEIDLVDFGADQSEIVSLRFVAEIIEARVEEIFEKVEEELRKINREGLLPAGVILSGGGAKLHGMIDVAKRVLRLPCALGVTNVQSSMPEVVNDLSFSTAVGLVLWAYEKERREDGGSGRVNYLAQSGKSREILKKLGSPIKKIFKSFVP